MSPLVVPTRAALVGDAISEADAPLEPGAIAAVWLVAAGLAASMCVNLGKVVLGVFLASAGLAYWLICAGRALEPERGKSEERP